MDQGTHNTMFTYEQQLGQSDILGLPTAEQRPNTDTPNLPLVTVVPLAEAAVRDALVRAKDWAVDSVANIGAPYRNREDSRAFLEAAMLLYPDQLSQPEVTQGGPEML